MNATVTGLTTGAAALLRWAVRLRRRRARFWVAYHVNRVPGMCWARLVSWSLAGPGDREYPWWRPLQRVDDMCRRDAAECGVCYCGSLTDPAGDERWAARTGQPDTAEVTR